MTKGFEALEVVRAYIQSGGPVPSEYHQLTHAFDAISAARSKRGDLESAIYRARHLSNGAFNSLETMQGFVCMKPHGYHGDFEIIDRIYAQRITSVTHLKRWDEYFHECAAAQAVRNRRRLFRDRVFSLADSLSREVSVLSIASGPCREIVDVLAAGCDAAITCVDSDKGAVGFSQKLVEPWQTRVAVVHSDALRWRSNRKFDLVWCAGLFDYLSDRAAVALLKRMRKWSSEDGEIIVGNFSTKNPTRAYMEFGDWSRKYRTPYDMIELARRAGYATSACRVEAESIGVNLFLCIATSGETREVDEDLDFGEGELAEPSSA